MKSETLSLKTIIKEVVFSKENSCFSMKRLKRKDLVFLANKLIEKIPGYCKLMMMKNTLSHL